MSRGGQARVQGTGYSFLRSPPKPGGNQKAKLGNLRCPAGAVTTENENTNAASLGLQCWFQRNESQDTPGDI